MSLENFTGFKAGGTVHVGHIVKLSGDKTVIECSAATDHPCAVAARQMRDAPGLTGADNTIAATVGQSVMLYGPGTIAPVLAGAAVAAGDWISSDGAGLGITAVATSAIIGQALEAASGANVEFEMMVSPMGIF